MCIFSTSTIGRNFDNTLDIIFINYATLLSLYLLLHLITLCLWCCVVPIMADPEANSCIPLNINVTLCRHDNWDQLNTITVTNWTFIGIVHLYLSIPSPLSVWVITLTPIVLVSFCLWTTTKQHTIDDSNKRIFKLLPLNGKLKRYLWRKNFIFNF